MSKKGCSSCGRHPEEEAHTCPECGMVMPTQGQWRAMRRRRRRSLALRLMRTQPGFPAVLLVPAVLGLWIWMWTVGRDDPRGMRVLDPRGVLAYREIYGLPLVFVGSKPPPRGPGGWRGFPGYGFKPAPFLADLLIALGTAYIVAMAVDRLVFPAVRAGQGRKRGRGETG